MTLPTGECVHYCPGRIRLRFRGKKGDATFFQRVKKIISTRYPKVEVAVNPRTGSLLLKGLDESDIWAEMSRSEKLFDLKFSDHKVPVYQMVQDSFKKVNLSVKKVTSGELDLPTFVFIVLIGSGLYQFLRGSLGAPPWYTAFWYALGIFTKSLTYESNETKNDSSQLEI